METVVGIFRVRADAERAVEQLRSLGVRDNKISFLTPGMTKQELDHVPTTETEQPGMGKALGGVVGGAVGLAGGSALGTAVASLLVPGVGPVIAIGIASAALLGLGGAAAGAAVGDAVEDEGAPELPQDELFVYEDALRQGRTVVIATAEDEDHADKARRALEQAGAESIDAAREQWWVGLRDAEEETYKDTAQPFQVVEETYRRGFEAALMTGVRGKSYQEAITYLRDHYPAFYKEEAFQRGYERGRAYQQSLVEKYPSQAT